MDQAKGSWTKVGAAVAFLCCCLGLLYGLELSNSFISHAATAIVVVMHGVTINALGGTLIFLLGALGALVTLGQIVVLLVGVSDYFRGLRATPRAR